jgi:DNA-binding CsgD family transcriptional regulator
VGSVSLDRYQRAADKIGQVARRPTDLVTLWSEASAVIGSIVPYYWTPCYYTLDPASLLVTSHFHDGMPTFPPQWLVNEYYGNDVNQLMTVARSPSGLSTLFDATGGNPQVSPRWHTNMQVGGDQELILRLRTRSGEIWGMLGLYRELGAPPFSDAEKAFLSRVAPDLADGARRALLIGEAREPDHPDAPGLVILDTAWQVRSRTTGVDRWLAEIADRDGLPSAVLAVAARAVRAAEAGEPDAVATARVRGHHGGWLLLHGACLVEDGDRRVAVIIDTAHPARLFPLLMAAYKLTERERDVTEQVLLGASTAKIATALSMTPNTVQQHLKSVFDKTGVHSRRDLVGRIFFTHYEPRFRDNEKRVAAGRPMRGGPMPNVPSGGPG